MSDTTKRRNGTLLTDRLCGTRPDKRVKFYDRKCRGLYVSITPFGVATFSCNFTNAAGRPTSSKVGTFHPEAFKVADARAKVSDLKAKGGAAIGEILRQQREEVSKRGVTVNDLIAQHVAWMKFPVKKDDGTTRARRKSWSSTEARLLRFVSPRLGAKPAAEVTKEDIVTLSNDIVAGRYIVDGKPAKASTANARHMRRAASAMFVWGAGELIIADNLCCVRLPKLDKEPAKKRALSEAEIRTLWHGLDRDDLAVDRTIRLAIKFALVTMLRSGELLPIHHSEIDTEHGTVNIPAIRVKKDRVIAQPLSDLAREILKESLGDDQYVFPGRKADSHLSRLAMAGALRGDKGKPGICERLGLKPFTPHDLRRTAATRCGFLEPEGEIALCLDHQRTKDENGNDLPAVTNEVYNQAASLRRIARKRKVLDAWAIEIRRIIGRPAVAELRFAA